MSDYMAQLLQNPPYSTAKVRLIERLEDSRDNACLEGSTFHKLFSDCIVALAERDALLRAIVVASDNGRLRDMVSIVNDIRALLTRGT